MAKQQQRNICGGSVVATVAVVVAAIASALVLQRTNEDFRFQVATTHNSLADLQKRIWTAIESTIISGVVRTYIHTWQHAVVIAAQDSGRAVRSCSVLAYLTLRPVVWLLYLCGRGLLYAFYQYILVRGIFSPTAVNQMKLLIKKAIDLQLSLTRQQLAMEAGILVASALFYQIVKFLKRRNYLRRVKLWIQRRKQAVAQSYHRQVQRVADFSVKLALMTPHALFAATLIAIKLLVPFALTWLATETNLSSVFYLWYPLLASILVLFDVWRADCNNEQVLVAHVPSNGSKLKKVKKPLEEQKKTLTNSSNAAASPARSSPFPRTTAAVRKRNRRRSSLVSLVVRHNVLDASRSGDNNATEKTDAAAQLLLLHQRQVYWMHYWIVCGAVAMMKRFFFILPFVTRFVKVYPIIRSVLLQVELVAWIWIHVVPTLLTPVGIQQLQQYQTPLDILAVTCIAPVVTAVYNGVSSVVPAAAWQTYVVEACSKFLGVAVWSKLLTQSSCDALLHFTEHGRSLVVPALTVFSWPLQAFGILYVAYVLPLAKCSLVVAAAHSPQKTELRRLPITHWLQFWVLHTVLTGALNTCSALLWWIPFSNVAIWCAYAWLSVVAASSTIDSYYLSYVQQELQSFYILPLGDHQQSLPPTQEAKLMRLFWYIIDKLPKAVDDNDDENASAGDDDASGGDAVVSGDEDAFVGVGLVKKHGTGPSDDDTVSVGEEKENGAARKRYNSKPERDESPSGVDDSVTEDCVGFKQRSSNRSTRKTISKVEREESPSEDESGKDDSSLSSFAKETIASRTRRRRSATSRNS